MQEEYYPRGGVRRKTTNTNSGVKSENLFSTLTQRKGKAKTKRKTISHENEEVKTNTLHLTSADFLTYNKIVPGMVLLGCIRNVSPYVIHLELPGRTYAQVKINSISDALIKELRNISKENDNQSADTIINILSRMFNVRDFIPVLLNSVEKNEESSTIVMGSVNPKQINDKLTYESFEKGKLVWGCIIEKSEHVYVVDLGVKNTRATLPFKNCENKDYVIGTPLWLIVKACNVQDKVTTLTMSIKKKATHAQIQPSCTLNEIIPGMCVKFNVTKVLKDGLEGVFLNGLLGYINEIYVTTPMQVLQMYEGATVIAYVLYIHPTTKITYLTMRSLDTSTAEMLPKGHICKAKIIRSMGKGVIVKLNDDNIGLVTSKRLVKSLNLNPSADLTEAVKKKFRINSVHDCIVMDYNHMDMMYICSFEKNELKQPIFTISNLRLGQLVKGTVHGIHQKGITVLIGKLLAFASNEHISKTAYSENIKRTFRFGDAVLGRVWEIGEKSVKITLKQPFVEDDRCLTSYEMAKSNDQYKGVVAKHYNNAVLIRFYGGVKGLLISNQLEVNYKNMYYIGEVITVTISAINDGKLLLTMDVPATIIKKKLQVGDIVNGIVESGNEDGLFVEISESNIRGFIPVDHLSIDLKLAHAILALYKPGDTIENLICMQDKNKKILSHREFAFYGTGLYNIPKRDQLEPGTIVRCSVKTLKKKKLLLELPVIDVKSVILSVNKEDALDDGDSEAIVDLVEGQAVVAKIKEVPAKGTISASIKFKDVFSYDFGYSIHLLKNYLSDLELMKQKLLKEKNPLANYKIGERVSCRIIKINNVGCAVKLNDGTTGIVDSKLWPRKPVVDSIHIGVVLHVNFVDKYLELSLNNRINEKINQVQHYISNIGIGQVIHAKVLLIRSEFVLCSLGQAGNRQIAYMPTKLHENDFTPNYEYLRNLNNIRFVVQYVVNGKLIGFEKKLKSSLEKNKRKLKTQQNKRHLNTEEEDVNSVKKRRVSIDFDNTANSDTGDEENELQNNGHAEKIKSDKDEIMEMDEEAAESQASHEENEIIEEQSENCDGEESEEDIENMDVLNGASDSDNSEISEEEEDSDEENGDDNEKRLSESSDDQTSDEDNDHGEENDDPNIRMNGETAEVESKRRVSFSETVQKFGYHSDDNISDSNSNSLNKFEASGIGKFFDSDDEQTKVEDDSSEDETIQKQEKSKKKKLTRAEQVEIIRKQEEELRQKELEFADPKTEPQSAEQFDRRLLAEPNNSELWTKYVSFYLAATEIEKARSVINRALHIISPTAEQDKLNIWIASLNLENSYGTKDSFLEVFNEAVRRNDDFKVYVNAINILSSSNGDILDDIIKRARGKFKKDPKVYLEIGKVYYNLDRIADARKLKDTAIQILESKSDQISLTVQFGIMEFNYGEEQHAEALFETILQSYSSRVDVWSTYIDQLIKKGKIDSARRVLERCVAQNLTLKKMRALHKKFRDFEDKYGNDETRAEQRSILSNYAKKFSS